MSANLNYDFDDFLALDEDKVEVNLEDKLEAKKEPKSKTVTEKVLDKTITGKVVAPRAVMSTKVQLGWTDRKVWGKVRPEELAWGDFVGKLMHKYETDLTLSEYALLPTSSDRLRAKDFGGFVGARFKNEDNSKYVARTPVNVAGRQLLVVDIDSTKKNLDRITAEIESVDVESVVYSTFNNTFEKPRLRWVILLDRELTPHEFVFAANVFHRTYGEDIDGIDPSTFEVNRLMLLSSTAFDGEFYANHIKAKPLQTSKFLVGYSEGAEYKAPKMTAIDDDDEFEIELEGEDYFAMLSEQDILSTPADVVAKWLNKINPDLDYSDWLKVGQALHHWHDKLGLKVWDDWSRKAPDRYEEGVCKSKWSGFNANKDNSVTLGTIAHLAKRADYIEGRKSINQIITAINCAEREELDLNIIPKVRKLDIDAMEKDRISRVLQNRIQVLDGFKPTLASIKGLLIPKRGEFLANREAPEWCQKYVHVAADNLFYDINTRTGIKSESFNIRMGKYVPFGDSGGKQSATKYVADNGYVTSVDGIAYLPMYDDVVCIFDRTEYFNTYAHDTAPKPAREITDGGKLAIDRFVHHVETMYTGYPEGAEILISWYAHQVQNKGQLLMWAPLIQSVEGLGKSILADLLDAILGKEHVTRIDASSVAKSDFTDWATGGCVGVLEELRITGVNRYEAVNKLKDKITNRYISINPKGRPTYNTLNTKNYICFTNYRDALPLTETDRRWWVWFMQFETIPEFVTKAIRMGVRKGIYKETSNYFGELLDSLTKHHKEIHKFLMDYEIPEWFMQLKRAPMTVAKEMMVATEYETHASTAGGQSLIEFVTTGGIGFNAEVVSVNHLHDALVAAQFEGGSYVEEAYSKKELQISLKQLGYSITKERVFWNDGSGGKQYRVWVKKFLPVKVIREILDTTIIEEKVIEEEF